MASKRPGRLRPTVKTINFPWLQFQWPQSGPVGCAFRDCTDMTMVQFQWPQSGPVGCAVATVIGFTVIALFQWPQSGPVGCAFLRWLPLSKGWVSMASKGPGRLRLYISIVATRDVSFNGLKAAR